ncbi:MAG TPA: hypothetical protein VFO16_14435 [Pseudonocardiaceae bacterium]|nr:hypothetical protein [Pseudonocardiaceae bacterium]
MEGNRPAGARRCWPGSRSRGVDRDSRRGVKILCSPVCGGGELSQLIQPGAEFGRFFRAFEYTAFRLEVRVTYAPSYERESFERFLTGEPYELSWMQEWLSMIRDATKGGRRFSRVRVVSLPLSDYNRWSYVISQHNIAAGEDIRYLTRERALEIGLPDHDYWLFDSRGLLRMRFDAADRFIGGEIVEDPSVVVRHNYWRDAAWHHAIRRDRFATEEQFRRPERL